MYQSDDDWRYGGPENRWLAVLEGFLDYLYSLGVALMGFAVLLGFLLYARSILAYVIPGAVDLR